MARNSIIGSVAIVAVLAGGAAPASARPITNGSFETHGRFMTTGDGQAAIVAVREGCGISLGQVMGVHHKLTHTHGLEVIKGAGDQGLMKEGDEWLWQLIGERSQPLAQTCAENEGFLHARFVAHDGPIQKGDLRRSAAKFFEGMSRDAKEQCHGTFVMRCL